MKTLTGHEWNKLTDASSLNSQPSGWYRRVSYMTTQLASWLWLLTWNTWQDLLIPVSMSVLGLVHEDIMQVNSGMQKPSRHKCVLAKHMKPRFFNARERKITMTSSNHKKKSLLVTDTSSADDISAADCIRLTCRRVCSETHHDKEQHFFFRLLDFHKTEVMR